MKAQMKNFIVYVQSNSGIMKLRVKAIQKEVAEVMALQFSKGGTVLNSEAI